MTPKLSRFFRRDYGAYSTLPRSRTAHQRSFPAPRFSFRPPSGVDEGKWARAVKRQHLPDKAIATRASLREGRGGVPKAATHFHTDPSSQQGRGAKDKAAVDVFGPMLGASGSRADERGFIERRQRRVGRAELRFEPTTPISLSGQPHKTSIGARGVHG